MDGRGGSDTVELDDDPDGGVLVAPMSGVDEPAALAQAATANRIAPIATIERVID